MNRKTIYKDSDIVDFCRATMDTNEIHDPEYMRGLGKRAIVPGMFAFSCTAGLGSAFLRERATYIKVLFNSLLSSGEFVTLQATTDPASPDEMRLSAINHKDTLTSRDEYTRMERSEMKFRNDFGGILRQLPFGPWQMEVFTRLSGISDPAVARFLFAVSYASQALHMCIDSPLSEMEQEIGSIVCGDSRISPFYHTLEIFVPREFPEGEFGNTLDYYIHFEREKKYRLYSANVRCESGSTLFFHSRYSLMGIRDGIILRMAKDLTHPKPALLRND